MTQIKQIEIRSEHVKTIESSLTTPAVAANFIQDNFNLRDLKENTYIFLGVDVQLHLTGMFCADLDSYEHPDEHIMVRREVLKKVLFSNAGGVLIAFYSSHIDEPENHLSHTDLSELFGLININVIDFLSINDESYISMRKLP